MPQLQGDHFFLHGTHKIAHLFQFFQIFLGFCEILLIPFRVRLAILHANGHPLAIFVEQEIVQSPAIFRVFDSLFLKQMFKLVIDCKILIRLGHVEKSIFVLLPVCNQPGQGRGIGQNKRIFPVNEYRPVPGTKAH